MQERIPENWWKEQLHATPFGGQEMTKIHHTLYLTLLITFQTRKILLLLLLELFQFLIEI